MDGKKRLVMLVNFSQLTNARWLGRLTDLIQRHRTSLKYHHTIGSRLNSLAIRGEQSLVILLPSYRPESCILER